MFSNVNNILETVQTGFRERALLVVGDLMLDRYLLGEVERISPEAPVPVVRLHRNTHAAGGAANVAANLSALGCKVSVAGVLGADEDGCRLLETLRSFGVETTAVLSVPGRPTTCKTRVLGGRQQMLRFDVESVEALDRDLKRRILAAVEAQISRSSALVLSDYGKGLLDDTACQAVIELARRLRIPVFVDPKGLNYDKYRRSDVISPNRMELAAATSTSATDLDTLLQKGQQLRSDLGIAHFVVTLGDLGMRLLDSTGVHCFPAVAREVFDVSGAGDTVLATVSAAVAAGVDLHDAIRLANVAAGIVIGKVGTVPVSRDELLASLVSSEQNSQTAKVCSLETLLQQVEQWHFSGHRIVFTNGCFDLFHVGHLTLLENAKREGDRLVVALNTDHSVRALRGPGRPVIDEDARAKLVAALPYVDAVVLFGEETPLRLIQAVRPHVLVKGADYSEGEVVGAAEMKKWGGKVILIPVVEGFSTTAIVKKAVDSFTLESQGPVQ